MEGQAGRNVGRSFGHGAKCSLGSKDPAQKTPAVGTADGKQARFMDSRDSRAVRSAPKKLSISTAPGVHPEAAARSLNPTGGVTASNLDKHCAASPEHSRQSNKSSSSATSKTSFTTSSTSNKRPKTAEVGKHPAQSSATARKEPETEVAAGLQPNAARRATQPKIKAYHSGYKKPSKKHTTTNAPAIQAKNVVPEAAKGGSTTARRKSKAFSAPTRPTGPAPMRNGSPVANSQASTVTVTSKASTGSSSRSTTSGTSGVTPDSLVPVGMSGGYDIGTVASATPDIAATAANADDLDKTVKTRTMADETAAFVAKAPPDQRGARDGGRAQNRRASKSKTGRANESASHGGVLTANPEETGRKSGASSTFPLSFYPLNVSFLTELNSREELILYAGLIIACAMILAIFSVGLVLFLYPKHSLSPLACLTPECIEARGYLRRMVNTSRDACSDFYGYVCDSWLERRKDGGSFHRDNIAAWLAKINESLLRDASLEGHNHEEKSGLRVMRHIYSDCHRYVLNQSTVPSFETTLELARKQLNWNEVRSARSYKALVGRLLRAAILSGCQTIMSVQMFSDHDRLVLKLSRGSSLLRKLTATGNREDLENALIRVLKNNFSAIVEVDLVVDADLDGNRFAEGQEEAEEAGALKDFLDGILPNVTVEDWVHLLNEVLHSGGKRVLSADAAFATGAQYFGKAFRNLADANGVATTALYVASHLDAEVLSLELSREWMSSDPAKTAGFCLALAESCLTQSWPLIVAKLMDVRDSVNLIEVMYQDLAQASHDSDVLLTWLPKTMRSTLARKVDLTSPIVVSDSVLADILTASDDAEHEHYAPLLAYIEKQSVDFADTYLKAMAYGHQRRARSPPTLAHMYVSRFERNQQLSYSPALQSVVVPTVYQRAPYLYATGVPPHYNYATIGALLSARIAQIVAPAGEPARRADTSLNLIHPGPRQGTATSKYDSSVLCLQRLHNRLGLHHHASGSGEVQRRAMYLQAFSLRLAYEGLLTSFGPEVPTQWSRTMWSEAQKIFFIRFCLLTCDADQKPNPLSPRASCLLPLHTMPEFAAVFDCALREDFVSDNCPL